MPNTYADTMINADNRKKQDNLNGAGVLSKLLGSDLSSKIKMDKRDTCQKKIKRNEQKFDKLNDRHALTAHGPIPHAE